jgi:hypothetical protein
MILQEIDDVIGNYSGLSRTVLDYSQIMTGLVLRAKQPGWSEECWAPLAELVDTANFERIGNFKEVMNWPDYVAFLTGWAAGCEWEGSFKRITEAPNLVILELEERVRMGDFSSAVNSVSVYEFNDAGKIVHLDIYLQMALPDPASLESYEGIQITE